MPPPTSRRDWLALAGAAGVYGASTHAAEFLDGLARAKGSVLRGHTLCRRHSRRCWVVTHASGPRPASANGRMLCNNLATICAPDRDRVESRDLVRGAWTSNLTHGACR